MLSESISSWGRPTERERSLRAAERYALLAAALECHRAQRHAAREFRRRRLRHRTAQWLIAAARRLDAA